MLLAEGIQRLRHHQSTVQSVPLTPGQIEEVTVDCWSTSQIFTPGTAHPLELHRRKSEANYRSYCDAEQPSRLVVLVVE
jgi:predicted acyl esterase